MAEMNEDQLVSLFWKRLDVIGNDINDMRARMESTREDAAVAKVKVTAHEEICALRYELILNGQKSMRGQMWMMTMAIGGLALVEIAKVSIPDLAVAAKLFIHGG